MKILALGVLGSAAVMALPAGAAAAALADGPGGAPATAPATLTAAVIPEAGPFASLNAAAGSQNGESSVAAVLFGGTSVQQSVIPATADQATATQMFQGLLNVQPVTAGSQTDNLANVMGLNSLQAPVTQGDSQVQLAQLVPDPNSGTIGNTGIPMNQTIQPGGYIPSGNGITVTGPGVSVLTDSNGNAQVTIAGGMGANGPEPATTVTLPPNGEVHLGTGVLNVPSNASSVNLPPGTYLVGNPPADGQPDTRAKIIVDPPEPPAQTAPAGPQDGSTSNGQTQQGNNQTQQGGNQAQQGDDQTDPGTGTTVVAGGPSDPMTPVTNPMPSTTG